MKALYVTADRIGTETGGGIVTYNELVALKKVYRDVTAISRHENAPGLMQQPDSPFLYDYFTLHRVMGKRYKHAHFYSGTFTQTVRYLKSRGTRVTYTVPAHDRKETVDEFKNLGFDYPFPHISDPDIWSVYSEGYRQADQVIAPSTLSKEVLEKEGCKSVIVIPHGTSLPAQVAAFPETFAAGYLGAYGPDKGLIYLLQAWSQLNYPDSTLYLAGDGSEHLEPFIRKVAMNGRFTLLGRVPSASDLYNKCSVYVQPSVCEGFGIEILEAMAHGRPVVASLGAGGAEVIPPGCGVRVPVRSPQRLAEAIDIYKSHPYDLEPQGKRARAVAEEYTWEKVQDMYAGIFASF